MTIDNGQLTTKTQRRGWGLGTGRKPLALRERGRGEGVATEEKIVSVKPNFQLPIPNYKFARTNFQFMVVNWMFAPTNF
ncbi:MAG TPA: hypothetical protein DCZ75_17065 [Geobacter sp.]|nr:hypothetical protein [Geobacter sp.]